MKETRIFLIHAPEDAEAAETFMRHVAAMDGSKVTHPLSPVPGTDAAVYLRKSLHRAHVAVALLSSDFLHHHMAWLDALLNLCAETTVKVVLVKLRQVYLDDIDTGCADVYPKSGWVSAMDMDGAMSELVRRLDGGGGKRPGKKRTLRLVAAKIIALWK